MRKWDRKPRPDDPPPPPYGGPMLYWWQVEDAWWQVEDAPEANLRDPHQHDGVFSALACMESAQREWETTHPGITPNLHLIRLDGCLAFPMPDEEEAQIRAAFAKRRRSGNAEEANK